MTRKLSAQRLGLFAWLLAWSTAASAQSQTSPSIQGTWVLISVAGGRGRSNPMALGNQVKVFTGSNWTITLPRPDGTVMFHHGGTYTLVGDDYVERVEFATGSSASIVNREYRKKVLITGDTMVEIGDFGVETWRRVPSSMSPAQVAAAAGVGRGGVMPGVARGAGPTRAEGSAATSPPTMPARGTGAMPFSSEQAAKASAIPEFGQALDKAEAHLRYNQNDQALDAFKKANELESKTSAAAWYGMSRAYHQLGAFKNEANAATEGLKHVQSNDYLAALLHNQRGLALQFMAKNATDKALKDAESDYRRAMALSPAVVIARFNLGLALMKQSRDAEGRAALEAFAKENTAHPEYDMAMRLIANPRRARENYAADFRLTTMEGEYIESQELLGRTVVLDFWGTWCPPCRAATPELVRLQKKYAGDGFMMVGISSDDPANESAVREYVDRNRMVWPQNLDRGRQVHDLFQIRNFPTYIVIDAEGIVRERLHGWVQGTTIPRLETAIKNSMKSAGGRK